MGIYAAASLSSDVFLDDIELLFLNQVSNTCYTSLTVCITRFGSHVILLFQQVRGAGTLRGIDLSTNEECC